MPLSVISVSSPSGVWGGAPAEIEFGTALKSDIWSLLVATILLSLGGRAPVRPPLNTPLLNTSTI